MRFYFPGGNFLLSSTLIIYTNVDSSNCPYIKAIRTTGRNGNGFSFLKGSCKQGLQLVLQIDQSLNEGQRDGSVSKGVFCQAQQPDFDPQDPQGRNRKLTSTSRYNSRIGMFKKRESTLNELSYITQINLNKGIYLSVNLKRI